MLNKEQIRKISGASALGKSQSKWMLPSLIRNNRYDESEDN